MTMLQPQLKWAQRKDKLYITIDLQDCSEPDIKVANNEDGTGQFDFQGEAKGNKYELSTKLYAEIDPDSVQVQNTDRHVFLIVPKKEEGDHWPRLTPDKTKHNHIQVDWAKYLDQDDEEAGDDNFAPEGMGALGGGGGGMGGMGAMGGAGGMDMAQLQAMMAQQGAGGMGGMEGMGGMGGMDMGGMDDAEGDEDSDDDDLPDLEG